MAATQFNKPILRGAPIGVEFLGFRSDTYILQRHGWQIAEEEHHYNRSWHIAIKHPENGLCGLSERPIKINYERQVDFNYHTVHFHLAIAGVINITENYSGHHRFIPVDATPSYEVHDFNASNVYNMSYFRPIDEGKEIFLKQASVEEIMQIALDKQEPEAAAIRARRKQEQERENYRRGGETKARLILAA